MKRALRQPYGLMPAYTETQVSDQTIADLLAFFSTLPRADQFGPWRWQTSASRRTRRAAAPKCLWLRPMS